MADAARMRALAALTIRAQDDERARVARELHESAAQSLAALTYQLSAVAHDSREPAVKRRLHELREQAGLILEEIRSMAHAMHPHVLDDLGLEAALQWLARQTREHTALDIEVDVCKHSEELPVDRESRAALYRVAQESIRNIERHAEATVVRVTLVEGAHFLSLDVLDNGRGFDLLEASTRRPGMGLFAMRERLTLVDGVLKIDTSPGNGTRVHASVPMTADRLESSSPESPTHVL